jgi:hypothetical protein
MRRSAEGALDSMRALVKMFVVTIPGTIVFTRIPNSFSSRLIAKLQRSKPAFVAAYTDINGEATSADRDVVSNRPGIA